MLKRIYIDNYKCLVNFELTFDSMNLLLGSNGAGKSAVFDALRTVQALFNAEDFSSALPNTTVTKWQTSTLQQFEFDIADDHDIYRYQLHLNNPKDKQAPQVVKESLTFNENPVAVFNDGILQVFENIGYFQAGEMSFPWAEPRSLFSLFASSTVKTPIVTFRELLHKIVIVQISATSIRSISEQATWQLAADAHNFVSWYRHMSQDHGRLFEITQALRDTVAGFSHITLSNGGEAAATLFVHFKASDTNEKAIAYRFDELSDGQRVLLILYILVFMLQDDGYTICIDEPENYLALPEIQPWLTQVYDLCIEQSLQAILISHHPRLIDYLAAETGVWFTRNPNAPVRPIKIAHDHSSSLTISELIERGWLHE